MALKPGDKYYTGLMLNFGETLRRWAAQASQQLHDSYKMQKVWNGSRSNSVWLGRGPRTVYLSKQIDKGKGQVAFINSRAQAEKHQFANYSWYDEVWRRKEMQKRNPSKEYWYPTGMSYQISQHEPVTVVDDTIESATVDFHTTMGALYAEAGVGANGILPGWTADARRKPKTRPRHIKVFRKDPWTHTKRYTSGGWKPGQGHAVRPNTRQQVSLLSRRLKWASKLIFQHDLTIYLGYMLEQSFLELGTWVWSVDAQGLPVGMHYEPKYVGLNIGGELGQTTATWEEYLAKNHK